MSNMEGETTGSPSKKHTSLLSIRLSDPLACLDKKEGTFGNTDVVPEQNDKSERNTGNLNVSCCGQTEQQSDKVDKVIPEPAKNEDGLISVGRSRENLSLFSNTNEITTDSLSLPVDKHSPKLKSDVGRFKSKSNPSSQRNSVSESTIFEEDLPVIVRRRGCMLRVRITSITDDDLAQYERECVGFFFL